MEEQATAAEAPDWRGHVERSLLDHWRRRAAAAYRALGRVTGDRPATLESLLTAVASGDGDEVRDRLSAARFPDDGYRTIILTAAFDAGVFRVRIDRDGPARLCRTDGTDFDVEPLAAALAGADAVAVPRLKGMLAELGIDAAETTGGDAECDPAEAVAVGAMSHMRLDGEPRDLVIADVGLLFVPCPTSVDNGRERLRQLLTTVDGVAGIARLPGARWLPFEEIATVRIVKETPVKSLVTLHDGTEIQFGWTWIGEEIGDSGRRLLAALRPLAGPAG